MGKRAEEKRQAALALLEIMLSNKHVTNAAGKNAAQWAAWLMDPENNPPPNPRARVRHDPWAVKVHLLGTAADRWPPVTPERAAPESPEDAHRRLTDKAMAEIKAMAQIRELKRQSRSDPEPPRNAATADLAAHLAWAQREERRKAAIRRWEQYL